MRRRLKAVAEKRGIKLYIGSSLGTTDEIAKLMKKNKGLQQEMIEELKKVYSEWDIGHGSNLFMGFMMDLEYTLYKKYK